LEFIRREADEVAVVTVPSDFGAVGEYFELFPAVTDEDVVEALRRTSLGVN